MKASSARLLLLRSSLQLCHCAYPKAAEQLHRLQNSLKLILTGKYLLSRGFQLRNTCPLSRPITPVSSRGLPMQGICFCLPHPLPPPHERAGSLQCTVRGSLPGVETELKEPEKFSYKNQHSMILYPLCEPPFPWVAMASSFSMGWW